MSDASRKADERSSVWRPLEHVVQDSPLAFCDPTSVSDQDLVECDHVRRKFKGATLYSHFNDAHKWCYVGNHRPDEVLLLKMFDSDSSVAARSESHPASCIGEDQIQLLNSDFRIASCVFPSPSCHPKLATAKEHRGSRLSLQLPDWKRMKFGHSQTNNSLGFGASDIGLLLVTLSATNVLYTSLTACSHSLPVLVQRRLDLAAQLAHIYV